MLSHRKILIKLIKLLLKRLKKNSISINEKNILYFNNKKLKDVIIFKYLILSY